MFSYTSNLRKRMFDFQTCIELTSKMHRIHAEVDFESSRSPAESESWNSPKLTVLCCFLHMTILPVVTCVTNVIYIKRAKRSSQALVCDSSSQFVVGPKNVWSTNSCQNKDIAGPIESIRLTILRPFPILPF